MQTCQHLKTKKRNHLQRRPEGPTIEAQRADKLKSSYGVWGSAVSSPIGVWGEAPADFYYGAVWASQMASGDRIFFKDLCVKIPSFYGSNEWNGKAEFHKFRAEKRRKCGIILPKAEWSACLQMFIDKPTDEQ